MKIYTDEELNGMNLDTAACDIENAVYAACGLYERLEGRRRLYGNGHHMAQQVATFAKNLMIERWEEPKK